MMAGYEIKPIERESLPEIAAFLQQQQEITWSQDRTQARPSGDQLGWMLYNPHLREGIPLGLCLRAGDGKLAGMIISPPRLYKLGDRDLLGLAAGHFFVDASARMQGFFMLRRYMGLAGIDFYFANSCNRQSAPLWAKCGAAQVPEAEVEYLFPFRLGPIAEELAIRKGVPKALASLARVAGPAATLVAAPRVPKNPFKVEYCTDLERLAHLADRCRNPELLQPDRSLPYMKWVYGSLKPSPGAEKTHEVYTFADPAGREGWFSLTLDRAGIATRSAPRDCSTSSGLSPTSPSWMSFPPSWKSSRPRADC